MKKFLLFSGAFALGYAAMAAEVPQPKVFEDSWMYTISNNGVYAASTLYGQVKIFNLATGQIDSFGEETGTYSIGIGKCISDNGILVGSSDDMNADYYKDGEWFTLPVPESAISVNLANAITPDGSRICGSLGVNNLSLDGDVLMQAPCIWNATADGYSEPVLLPCPEFDFSGRVPQYITAVDISDDGKRIIGQVRNATGFLNYPILYSENENGEWSYEIVHEELLNPDALEFPPYPGDAPALVNPKEFMSEEQIAEYEASLDEYYASGFTLPFPEITDYMTDEELAAYNAALEEYQAVLEQWELEWNAWMDILYQIISVAPNYEFNSIRISPDGKYFASTLTVSKDNDDPLGWGYNSAINVWVFDINSGEIIKYDQSEDLNLTYLCNDGVALAATSIGAASNAFVLKDGKVQSMYDWMSENCAPYAEWIKENMTFEVTTYIEDPETGEFTTETEEMMMTGRAIATPDLSVVAMTIENTFDWGEDSVWMARGYVFNVAEAGQGAVESIRPVDGVQTIFDLNGRRLNEVNAPGIYIINGEKKSIR